MNELANKANLQDQVGRVFGVSNMKRLYQEAASGSAAAPGPKRPNENDGSDELVCSICFDLAVDAVQVSCCGALHCRACISKCTACPMCRNPVLELVPDIRRERLSAATLRQCPHQGCAFEGNRASVASHEEDCEFVPRAVLKEKNLLLQREALQAANASKIRIEQLEARQRAFVACAMSAQPAMSALRLIHNVCPSKQVFEIDRSAAGEHCVCVWRESAFVPCADAAKVTGQEHVDRMLLTCDADLISRTLSAQSAEVDVSKGRCYKCGASGHWAKECYVSQEATVNERLFYAGCCSHCGIPLQERGLAHLHTEGSGKFCKLPRLFLDVSLRCC